MHIDQHVGRASSPRAWSEGLQDSRDERRLPRAEISGERDPVAGPEEGPQVAAEGARLAFRAQERAELDVHPVHQPFGTSVATGRIISSREIPPCWKLPRYLLSYSWNLVG